jgi:hypothetical protein
MHKMRKFYVNPFPLWFWSSYLLHFMVHWKRIDAKHKCVKIVGKEYLNDIKSIKNIIKHLWYRNYPQKVTVTKFLTLTTGSYKGE